MPKWHLNPAGESGLCRAENGGCPFGQHFDSSAESRSAFEKAAEFTPLEQTKNEREVWGFAMDDLIALNEAVDDGHKLTIAGTDEPHLDIFREKEKALGNSRELAEYMRNWTDSERNKEEGIPAYSIVEHTPVGALVGVHSANSYPHEGETYIVDFGFAEIDPNREWPYVGSLESWQREVDKASTLGAPEKEPEPIDPQTLSLAVFEPGSPNPLLERAAMDEGYTHINGTKVNFLVIDSVKVAAVHYAIEDDGKPHIHSLETRAEYRNQGYMKKLLAELAKANGVEKVFSSGSMTNDGLNFTRKYTEPRPGQDYQVKWPEYGTEGRAGFSFVENWVTGYSRG